MQHLRACTLAPVIVLLAYSCSGGSTTPQNPTASSTNGLDPVADAAAFALAHATEEQKGALADGIVTASEYEAATLATASCLTEQGIALADAPHWDEETRTRMRFSFVGGPTIEESQKTNALYEECRLKYSAAVEHLWITQDLPSETTLQKARASLEKCIREAGLDVPEGATSAELGSFSTNEAFWPCAKAAEREFQLPGFAG
jgi:hypothetical protein